MLEGNRCENRACSPLPPERRGENITLWKDIGGEDIRFYEEILVNIIYIRIPRTKISTYILQRHLGEHTRFCKDQLLILAAETHRSVFDRLCKVI